MTTDAPPTRTALVAPGVGAGLVGTVLTGVAAVALAAAVSDGAAVAGAGVGGLMVVAFFGFGALTVGVVSALAPQASLLVALLTYTLQVALVGLVFYALTSSGATDEALAPEWIGGTVIAGTLVWTIALVVGSVRSRQPAYDLPVPAPVSPPVSEERVQR